MHYDMIGDLHGHADSLKALLSELGYRERHRAWRHKVDPENRTVI